MSKLGKLGAKKKESDSEDDEDKAPPAKGGDDTEGGELKRGGAKARFGAKDSDSDSDDDGAQKKEAMRKRKEEAAAKKAALAAKKEKVEKEEIEKAMGDEEEPTGENDDAAGVGGGSPGETGALKRKDEKAKTRFSKTGESLEINREDEDRTPTGQMLARNPSKIPWHTQQTRQEREKDVYMSLAQAKKSDKTMANVREQMRKQGLYVARERVLLPGNVERAMQRVRIRKEHADKVGNGDPADSAPQAAVVLTGSTNFSPEEERYLVPFDPLKERYSRPAMRYEPYMPYLQYTMLVPVTNMDSVFGPAEPSKLLELEIRKLTLTDHPYFCEEDFLAATLEGLWRKYKQRAEMKWVEFYTQKIDAIKAALDIVVKERELTSAGDAGGGGKTDARVVKKGEGKAGNGTVNKEPELHQELGRHRLLRAAEEFEDLSIVSSMIRVWERVKEVRKGQNFISTKVDLKFKKQAVDSKSDLANRDEELDAEMAELRRLHEHDFEVREVSFLENKAKLETDIKRKKARIRDLEEKVAQANMAEGSDEDASDDDGEDDKPATKAGVSKPGDGKVALKLQSDAEAEKQSLEKSELLFEKLKAKQPKLADVPLDEETERAKIRERQSKTKRQAGDPMYIPILTDRTQRTETESLPDGKSSVEEGKRRKKIRSLKLVMRISVNGHMLRNQDGQVREIKLQQRPGHDFEFTVNEAIKLAATSGNPEIMIHVCESHGPLLTTELATLLVPIADDVADDRGDPYVFQDSRSDRAFEPVWYEADKKGSSKAKPDDHLRASGLHYITGEIKMRLTSLLAMQTDDGGLTLNIDQNAASAVAAEEDEKDKGGVAKGSIMSVPKLKKMIQMNKLDPNDPRNRHLLDLLSANKEQDSEGFVRFDTIADMLRIGGDGKDETIKFREKANEVVGQRWVGEQHLTRPAGIRQKMLMTRSNNPALFANVVVGWNPIPIVEKEIDDDDMLNKVYSVEFPDADEMDGPSVDDKKVQKVMKFRQKVQEQVRKAKAKHGTKVKRVWRLEDVVHQPALPVFGGADIIAAIVHLLRKRAALRPELNAVKTQVSNPSSCSISVTVQRAHNLPRRRTVPGSVAAPHPLECIVEARFDNQMAETPVAKGNEPAWNSRLRLKFEAPSNNWGPSNLLKVAESLHLTVFDTKVWESGSSEGRIRKVEKRWLGSVQFPFTTLYSSAAKGRIDGVFALDAPPHMIGYTNSAPERKGKDIAASLPRRPSLQVCVSLDPPLAQPGSGDDGLDGNRLPGQAALDSLVRTWIADCSRPLHCRSRTYEALGRSLHRDWVLACRFMTPQPPPQPAYNSSLPLEKQMLQLARFVGLIPFLDDFQLEGGGDEDVDPDSLDVWCTSNEFIDIMAGDWEEHAALLCNFFNHICPQTGQGQLKSYLVVGRAIPEGNTVYTITVASGSDDKEVVDFWNASKGVKYSQNDAHCTLKEIFYVVSDKNIWGNIQHSQDLRHTKFDFTNARDWKPLFTEKFLAANEGKILMDTVQESIDWKLNQRHADAESEVKTFVQNLIRGRLEHWRGREGKSLNDNMSLNKKMEEILKRMELDAHQEAPFTEDDLHNELDRFLKANDITGFYINRPFTEIEPIIQEIYNADIHHAGPISEANSGNDRDTQFAIAVYVKSFPRRILSLWVAVACCSRKRL